jgi:hypothetical protein
MAESARSEVDRIAHEDAAKMDRDGRKTAAVLQHKTQGDVLSEESVGDVVHKELEVQGSWQVETQVCWSFQSLGDSGIVGISSGAAHQIRVYLTKDSPATIKGIKKLAKIPDTGTARKPGKSPI